MVDQGKAVDLMAIRHGALLPVEDEKDDISGAGTRPRRWTSRRTCARTRGRTIFGKKGGHYDVFKSKRFRVEIAPCTADFIRAHD